MTSIKQKFLLTLGSVVLSISGLALIFLYLYQNKVLPLMESFGATETAIREAERRITFYNETIDPELKKYGEEVKNLQSLFFAPGRELEFIIFIEKVAKRNTLKHSLTTTPIAGNLQASVALEGEYQNILQFLREIQNEKFFLTITNILLGPGRTTIQMKLY